MNREYTHYIVNDGPIKKVIEKFFKDRLEHAKRGLAICAKHNAKGSLWSSGGISGLTFDTPPKGWRRMKKGSEAYVPGEKHPDRDAIFKEFGTSCNLGVRELQDRIVKKESMLLYSDKHHDLYFMAVDSVGDDDSRTYILKVPYLEEGFIDWKKNKGDSMEPPMTMTPWPIHPSLTPIKKSEYFNLKGE